jgi:undecaprenyl diphosphate synthase
MTFAKDYEAQPAAPAKAPRHVAIIMDGNGRWATTRGLPRVIGHREGAKAARRTVEAAAELGVTHLTLFSFSSENWGRPKHEVEELMNLLRRSIKSELADMLEMGVHLKVIGDRYRLPADVVRQIEDAERRSAANAKLFVTVALSYGSRQEIAAAARRLGEQVKSGELDPSEINEDLFGLSLQTAGLPDPDLLIRTSGEKRISNFLLWQCAYSEMVFLDCLWPDFGKDDLRRAIEVYGTRERRFGAAAG